MSRHRVSRRNGCKSRCEYHRQRRQNRRREGNCGSGAAAKDSGLLLKKALDGPAGGLLTFEEAEVKPGGLFLHLLQHHHALAGNPQGFDKNHGAGCGVPAAGLEGRGSRVEGRVFAGVQFPVPSPQSRPFNDRSPFISRLHVVGPADRYRHGRLLAGRGRGRLVTGVPQIEPDVVTKDGQLGQDAGQIGNAGALAVGRVKGQGQVIPHPEDRLYQTRQASAGAHLHKGADSGGMERLDLGHELHRSNQLPGEERLGRVLVVRIRRGGSVGVYRQPGLPECDIGQSCQERFSGVGHQLTMKGGSHRQALAGELAGGKYGDGPLDLGAAAGKNRLRRSVPVGDDQVESLFGKSLLDNGQRSRYRQHPPLVATAGRHEMAAQAGKVVEGRLVQPSAGTEGCQFSIAVARHGVRGNSE